MLHTRHCIDDMHVEKDVCDSLIGLLLNISDKTKDGMKARLDRQRMGIRRELWSKETTTKTRKCDVKIVTPFPLACYTLSKAEMHSFCECLYGVKLSFSYSANIGKLVSMKDHKLFGM